MKGKRLCCELIIRSTTTSSISDVSKSWQTRCKRSGEREDGGGEAMLARVRMYHFLVLTVNVSRRVVVWSDVAIKIS